MENKISLKQNGRFYYGWVLVFVGFIMMLLGYVSYISVTSVFVVPVTKELHVDRADFVFYQTILCLSCVAAAAFYGKRMAKGNIKRMMAFWAILSAAAFFGFSKATVLWQFYLLAVILGIGFACVTTMPVSIILNNWFEGKVKGTAMGFTFIGSGIGGLILIPILNFVITSYGWRAGYLTLALFFLVIITPCILFLIVKTPEEKGFVRMGQTAEEKSIAEADGLVLKDALKTPMLWLISISVIIFVFASSGIMFNSTPYFLQCGFSPAKAATFAALNVGALAIGKPLIGLLCDKFGTKFGSVFSSLVFAASFAFLFIMPLSPALLVYGAILCYGVGGGGITVCPPLLVNSLFGEKDYGNIIAVLTMATNIGGAFGGMLAATIYDKTGSYSTFWLIATMGLVLSALFRIISFRMKRRYDS